MAGNTLASPHRNVAWIKHIRWDAQIRQCWGTRRFRHGRCLVNIVPMELTMVAVQKYKLHYFRGKRRLLCEFWGHLRQHSDTIFTWLKSCFSVKVRLEGEQWNGLPPGRAHLPSVAVSCWVFKVKSVPPLVLSFAAIWVLCSGFEDRVPLMHYYYYYYVLFAPKASVVVGFLLSLELYSAAEFLDWMEAVWQG